MKGRCWFPALLPIVMFCALGPPAVAEDETEKTPVADSAGASEPGEAGSHPALSEPIVFEMEEVPAFGATQAVGSAPVSIRFPRGQNATCRDVPSGEVRAYPELKSKRPMYGSVTFDSSYYSPQPGLTFHFVFDESGEAVTSESAKTAPETGASDPEKPSLLQSLAKALTGSTSTPSDPTVVGPPRGLYDRLYFDLNGDLDLTNDGVSEVVQKSGFPSLANVRESGSARYFGELAVAFDYGEPVGKRPFLLVPRMQVYGPNLAMVQFIPKLARRGKVQVGGQECVVCLTQSSTVSGRYDRPFVQLEVFPPDGASASQPVLKSGYLGQMQLLDGLYITLSASPLGDKLHLTPYRGDLGVLQVGTGGRPITEFGVAGQLIGRSTVVLLGGSSSPAPEVLNPRFDVPVGDYMLPSVTAQYSRIRFNVRAIPNTVVTEGGRTEPVFNVQIRKDKPYILEFSAKPEVKFSSPRDGQVFKPGNTIYVGAMLTEPWQGLQITGLWDATRKEGSARYISDGQVLTVAQYAKLDPTIVIRDSAGKEVASGTMPFG